jgi:cell division protein ZapA
MAGSNRVVVMIGGVRYPIKTLEEPGYVQLLAAEMDEALRVIMQQGNLSQGEALVLLGLEYLDSYKKADRNLDNIRSQLSQYLEDAHKARAERDEALRALERAKKPAMKN